MATTSGDPDEHEHEAGPPVRTGPLEYAREAFWVIALAVIACYLFFLVLGAYSFGDVLPISLLIGLLFVLWVVHALIMRRHADDEKDPRLTWARERRGF